MTESEEMYLVSIARIKEKGEDCPIALSRLAADMDVMPVSANQMIRKLEEAGWVCYTPYKGVDLTGEGERLAMQILRHRRLWEVFLVENLKIPHGEAGELACRMEHFLPDSAADRLSAFLGNPTFSPLGSPIPSSQSNLITVEDLPLSNLMLEEWGKVTRIEADSASRAFLISEGIFPDQSLKLLAASSNGALLVQTEKNMTIHLSQTLAKMIWVKRDTSAVQPN